MVSIIVAMDEKQGIGKNNSLLFKIPEDMQRMKALTIGHPLVMGRKTFESLGRLLPDRTHIVITGNPQSLSNLNYQPHHIASTLEEGIDVGEKIEQARLSLRGEERRSNLEKGFKDNKGEVFIFGGARVYSDAIKKGLVDKLYLTIVKGDYHADVFFPEYTGFKIIKQEYISSKDFSFTFRDLIKE